MQPNDDDGDGNNNDGGDLVEDCTGPLTARQPIVLEANHRTFQPLPGTNNLAFTSTGQNIQSSYFGVPPALDRILISFDPVTGETLTTTEFNNWGGISDVTITESGWLVPWIDGYYEQSGSHVTSISREGIITGDKLISPVVYGSNGLPSTATTLAWKFAWSESAGRYGAVIDPCKFQTFSNDLQPKSGVVQLSSQCDGSLSPRVLAYGTGFLYAGAGYNGSVAQVIKLTGTGQKDGDWKPLLTAGSVTLMYQEPGPSGRACIALTAADKSVSISCIDDAGIVSASGIVFAMDGAERKLVWNGTSLGVLAIPADSTQPITVREVNLDGTWSPDVAELPNNPTLYPSFIWTGREYAFFHRPNDDFSDRTMTIVSRCN
jgi:hypothetical protein